MSQLTLGEVVVWNQGSAWLSEGLWVPYNGHLLICWAGREEMAERQETRLHGCKLVLQWQWEELVEFCLLSVRQPPGVISVSRMCSCLPSSTKLELLQAVGLPRYQLLAPFCFLNTDCIKWKSPSFSIPYKTFFLVTYSIICPFISTKLKVCC